MLTKLNTLFMSVDAFEKTNFGWQMQQQLQQLGEWVELTVSQIHPPTLPGVSLSPWLSNLLRLLLWIWSYKEVAFWVIIGLFLSWIVWQVWRLWGDRLSSFPSRLRNSASRTDSGVSELTVSAWLQRAQEFYRQGNYGEACRNLYMAMLQKLHETGIAPHQLSRTDGEYRQLMQELPQAGLYQTLLTTHEQLCFGNAEISADDFAQCQQAYQQIQGQEATPPQPPSLSRRNRRWRE